MDRFRVEVIAQTPNPQRVIYAAMHQDYTDQFVFDQQEDWPNESKCGEVIVKRLLAGERGHYGPLEHVQIVFNCGYFPHSVMQQARTHRVGVSFDVQCLAANTEITFVDINGTTSPKLKKTIGELYDLWTNGEPSEEYARESKKRIQKMRLRVLNEKNGQFTTGSIKDVMCSGIQPVYRVRLVNGQTLDCTANHRLFTSQGWQTLKEAVGLITNENYEVIALTKKCKVFCNGIHPNVLYKQPKWLKEQIQKGLGANQIAEFCNVSPSTIRDWAKSYKITLNSEETQGSTLQLLSEKDTRVRHLIREDRIQENSNFLKEGTSSQQDIISGWKRPSKEYHQSCFSSKLTTHLTQVKSVEYLGEQMTYDLEVEGEWHNFVANGMVVHNSFRYTGKQFIEVIEGRKEIEEVFYLRPVGSYRDRQGKSYDYSPQQREDDLKWCLEAAKRYQIDFEAGMSEEHARGKLPFDYRQHFVVSFNLRSLLHFLDLRYKKDAQLEIQKLCDLMWNPVEAWVPEIAEWYKNSRLGKARLSP